VAYLPGDAPLLLAAPHGGDLEPPELGYRSHGVRTRDRGTLELAQEVVAAFEELTGARPHLITCHLHRKKLDANRELDEAAQGDPGAERAWREYHARIEEASVRVTRDHGQGLFVDVHGHAHALERVELGYLLDSRALALSDRALDDSVELAERCSLRRLTSSSKLSQLVRGPRSLGAELERAGFASVPSPVHPGPDGQPYFSGGYSTARHGSRDGGRVDAIQLEAPRRLRLDAGRRRAFARATARALVAWLEQHHGWRPPAPPEER